MRKIEMSDLANIKKQNQKRRAQTQDKVDTMTVSELIAALNSMDPNMPVVAGDMKYTDYATRVDIGTEDVPRLGPCVMIYTNLEVLNPD
jgi:hypothetical protein